MNNTRVTHHALKQIIPTYHEMNDYLHNDALFSPCRRYRYALWRIWDDAKPHVVFVGLNPSTADEVANDPTLIRCIKYAQSWGYGRVCMANLFAYRATKPAELLSAENPVGTDNDKWLSSLTNEADLVVAAWGNLGKHLGRAQEVVKLPPDLHCLKINKSGQPAHPLYLRADLRPFPFHPTTPIVI